MDSTSRPAATRRYRVVIREPGQRPHYIHRGDRTARYATYATDTWTVVYDGRRPVEAHGRDGTTATVQTYVDGRWVDAS